MFNKKEDCRIYLQEVKPFINLSKCCEKLNIDRSSMSLFIKSSAYDFTVSLDTANKLVDFINSL